MSSDARAVAVALGTVQWGLDYGIANQAGPPSDDELRALLAVASRGHVRYLDTAMAYGSAERRIGDVQAQAREFRIVTKLRSLHTLRERGDLGSVVRESVASSLEQLQRASVDALLAHDARDLLSSDGETVWTELTALRAAGLIGRLGVSVYEPEEVFELLEHFPIEVVQLPLNIYDQRFVTSGCLARLVERRVEVHVRSIFLQGALLMDADALPAHLDGLRGRHRALDAWCAEHGHTRLHACLAFAKTTLGVDCLVVGAERSRQLEEIISALNVDVDDVETLAGLAVNDLSLILPSRWPSKEPTRHAAPTS